MSFLLFQQNLPFQAVINYLRLYEPSCTTPPQEWADQHAGDVTVGDIVFALDPIYSPWGDSSTGIGVADGDSFKVSQACFIYKREGKSLVAFALTADVYEYHLLPDLLAHNVQAARSASGGFYYAIVRPADPLLADKMRALTMLDSYGTSGWRTSDAGVIDIPVAFLGACGIAVDPALNDQVIDVGQLAYMIFSDKEPPAGSRYPDLRRRFLPVGRNVHLPVAELSAEPGSHLGGLCDASPASPAAVEAQGKFSTRRIIPTKPQSITPMPTASSPLRSVSVPQQGLPGVQDDASPDFPQESETSFVGEPGTSPPPLRPAEGQVQIPVAPPLPSGGPPPLPQASSRPVPPPLPQAPAGPVPPPLPSHFPGAPSRLLRDAGSPEAPLPDSENSSPFLPRLQSSLGSIIPGLRKAPSGPVPPMPSSPEGGSRQAEAAAQESSCSEPAESLPADLSASFSGSLPEEIVSDLSQTEVKGGAFGLEDVSGVTNSEHVSSSVLADGESVAVPIHKEIDTVEPQSEVSGANPFASGQVESVQIEMVSKVVEEELPAAPASPDGEPAAAVRMPGTGPLVAGKPVEGILNSLATAPPIAGMPPRKKKMEAREASSQAELPSRAHLKEPAPVKSGVAGLVSKLEQQASKASSRLESQVEEIQGRLSAELTSLLDKVGASERRSVRSAEGLRKNLLSKMEAAAAEVKQDIRDAALTGGESINEFVESGRTAIDEKHEQLKVALRQSFEGVREKAEDLARSFEEGSNSHCEQSLGDLRALMESLEGQLNEAGEFYCSALQEALERFKGRILDGGTYMSDSLSGYYNNLDREIEDLHERARKKIEFVQAELKQKLDRMAQSSQLDSMRVQAASVADAIVPRLKEHREILRVMILEFQQKLASDLEERGGERIAQIEPLLEEKKQELSVLLADTAKIKEALEDRQREHLERICHELIAAVDGSIEEANVIFQESEEQVGQIDRAVRILADPSSIEGDLDLLSQRADVLEKLAQCADQTTQEVHAALKEKVAALEERGKALQEDLISSMEEDAYLVRRTSEQVLNRLRENIQETFAAIQAAQDERME